MPSTNNNNTKSNSNDAVAQQKESSSSPSKRSISADAVKAPEFVPQQQRPQQNQQRQHQHHQNQNQQRQGRTFQQRDDPGRQAHVEFTRNLVEFYFSPENLAFDTYLASCLSSKRLMPIQALVQFPRMLENRVTPALIIEACQLTNKVTLELSRETHAYWIGPSVPGCHPNQSTLILREIPVQVGKEEVFERLNAVLTPLGSFLESIAPASKHNGTWFLNFVNGASARIALKSLAGTPNMWKPTANTVIRFKEAAHTGHVRSSFAPVPFQTGAAPVNGGGGGPPGPNPQFQQVVHAFQQATQGEEHILDYQQQNRNRSRSHSRRRHVPTAMSRGGRGGKFSGRGGGGNARAQSRENNNSTKQQQTRTASGNSRTSERSSNSSNGRRSPLAEAFLTPFPSPENKGKSKNITNTAASPPSQATRNVTSPDVENNKNKKFEGITSPPKKLPPKTEEMPALASEENNNSNNNSPSLNFGKLFNNNKNQTDNSKTEEKENNNNNNKAKAASSTTAPEKKNTAATKTVTVKETEEEKNENNKNQQQNRSSSRQNNNNRNNSRSGSAAAPRTSSSSSRSAATLPASGYKPLGGPHMSLMFGEGTHSYHRDFQQYFKAVADFGILPPSVEARLKKQSTPEGQASLPVSDAAHAAGISNQQNPHQPQQQGEQQNGHGTPVRPLTQAEQQLMWQLMMQYQQSMGYSADPYSYNNDENNNNNNGEQQNQTNGAAAKRSSSSQNNNKKEKQQFPTHASSSKNNNNNTNGGSKHHHQDPNTSAASMNNGEQQQQQKTSTTEKNDDNNNNKQKRVMNNSKTVATNGHKK